MLGDSLYVDNLQEFVQDENRIVRTFVTTRGWAILQQSVVECYISSSSKV